jgi:hypothetical protein
MLHRLAGLALAVLALLVSASVAAAAPVTVNLRIEGSAGTLFEGPVTTDADPALATPSSVGPHPCDVKDNGANAGVGASAGTPTTALATGARAAGLPFDASFTGVDPVFGSVNDFFVSRVGADVNQSAPPFASWGVALNFQLTSVGGCQIALGTGDDVLWAYDVFNKLHILRLTGPTTASVGATITVNVVDGQSGAPVAGASVGGTTTDAAGNARVTLTAPGIQRLKAEEATSVRSNALVVAVGAAAQAAQGAAQGVAGIAIDRTAPRARLLSPRSGHVYRRAKFSPRLIRVAVAETGSGVRTVKLRLTRRVGNRCFSFSGKRERFIGAKCGSGAGFFFTVSDRSDVSYLLPERLARGHYVLDVEAIDRSFNRDTVGDRGRNRSVFDVR